MFRIRRFGVMKTATVVALMYMIIVAIFAVPFLVFFAFLGAAGASDAQGGIGSILVLGVMAVLFYGILGWVFTAIACLVYNLAARWMGGIEVQVESVAPPAPPPAWIAQPPASSTPAPTAPASPSV